MKMGALGAFALVLYVAVVSQAQSPLQTLEDLQNAPPIPSIPSPDLEGNVQKNETMHDAFLRNMDQEVNVTRSVKKVLQDESITTLPSTEEPEVTTENQILTSTVITVSEALPTQQTVKLASDEPGNEDNPKDKSAAKKTFSVPRKGAEYNASLPEKGADLGQFASQASEVDMHVPTPVSIVSDSTVSQKNMSSELMGNTKSKSSSSSVVNTLPPGPIKKPIPSLISQSKASGDKFIPTTALPTIPVVKQNESSNSTKPEMEVSQELSTAVHSKPTAAVDNLDTVQDKEDDNGGGGTYTPAAIGIVLLLCILITVMVLGFQRLQDVWMRRHYARMDFLIDGMYDM